MHHGFFSRMLRFGAFKQIQFGEELGHILQFSNPKDSTTPNVMRLSGVYCESYRGSVRWKIHVA